MREWNLQAGDPLSLTIASDARITPTDYVNDQVWELRLGGGDPPALSLHTTYGLRARAMRLYPRFTLGENSLTDPADFAQPPVVRRVYPNYIAASCAPFREIDVEIETWVPGPQGAAGRMQITSRAATGCALQVEWVAQLTPTIGQRMAPTEIQAVTVLAGSSGGLEPVLFLTGGAKPGAGSYPSLTTRMELAPGETRQITWVLASRERAAASFELARNLAAMNWEAEISRLEVLNAGQVELYTGNPEWDAAFMLAQKQAFALLAGPTEHLPGPSFVIARQPDQGYSLRGDGSDYNHLWNGQPPLETAYLCSILLPAAPELARGLLRNFLAAQGEDGSIDWKPGLGGQRSKLLATPLLASLAWRIYEVTEDRAFLGEAFGPLQRFLQSWFTPQHDQDGDGIPEWDHPMQAGNEDHPVYARWHSWSQGVDISSAESVALCAFLYREARSLEQMAAVLGRDEAGAGMQTIAERMKAAVETAWDDQAASYLDWDRDTHCSTHGELLLSGAGSPTLPVERSFEQPVRLLIDVHTDESVRRRPMLFIHGVGAQGHHRVERIGDDQFQWTPGWGRMTGRHVYRSLERVEIHGLEGEDVFSISSASYDFQDHSTLAPLWAGIPSPERAERLIAETLTNPHRFWQAYGLPACIRPPQDSDALTCGSAHLPWNVLIVEGLMQYGQAELAAELVTRLMAGVVQALKRDGAFRRYYHAESGQGVGERNALSGLAPLGAFLETLGVRIISPTRVRISGINPFAWPVTVKYRGLTILRQKEKTSVIFPDGQTVTLEDTAPHIISLER